MRDDGSSGPLTVIVLGSAAGGGVPQWNCNCPVCRDARGGDDVLARTQSSIAVSANGADWCIFNCSPDIRQQILATPCLHPRDVEAYGRRDSPIHSIVLTNGDVDHVAGLLILREKQPFKLFATQTILSVLDRNPIFNVLDPAFVSRNALPLGEEIEVAPDLLVQAFPVPGKVALYLEEDARTPEGKLDVGAETENTIGLQISAARSGASFFYIPGCGQVTKDLQARLQGSDLVLFDGTLWENAEMVTHGVGKKTGQRMGHINMSGKDGSISAFKGLDVGRKVYVHINNTNPVLIETSAERLAIEDAGWEVAWDGMEIILT